MPSLFAGTENFNPTFEGRRLAIQSGAGAAQSLTAGMNSATARKRGELEDREFEFKKKQIEDANARLPMFKSWLDSQTAGDDGMDASGVTPKAWANSREPTLNVPKAQRIIQAFTNDPSWLADPRTAHAANAVFGAATKVVGMNMTLERLNNQGEAARVRIDFSKQKINDLSKVGPLVPPDDVDGQAELGRLNGMVGTDNFNLQEFSTGVARLQSKYGSVGAPEPMSMTLDDGTEVQGWVDPKTKRFTQYRPTALSGASGVDRRPVADTLTFADGKKVNVVYGPSGAPTVIKDGKEADDAHQKGLQDVAKSDLLDARKAVHKAQTIEEKELALKGYDSAKRNFDAVFRAAKPAAATNAPATSAPEKVRVKGPNGQTGTVPKDASLPEGWTLE